MGRISLLSFILLVFFASSCIPSSKITYLQETDNMEKVSDSLFINNVQNAPYQVQINDILNISIRSFNEASSNLFNVVNPNTQGNLAAGEVLFYLNGYSVDRQGYVDIPVLGKVYVLGKDVEDIKADIIIRLKDYFQEETYFVTVQLAGVRFTIVGEVRSPGKYIIYQNRVNIFEALASAGDIEFVGNRKEVQIIRQQPGGLQFFTVDLTKKDVVVDPRYFIQPNDIINVKPLPAKSYGIGTTGFATIASVLTVLSSTLLIIVNLQNL
ncbi:MAG: polysaccharide biosynthesis/export family protein [Owenweeksia sp.]